MQDESEPKKGISLNVIIIAAITLLILVILSVIFMNRASNGNPPPVENNPAPLGGGCGIAEPSEDSNMPALLLVMSKDNWAEAA